MDAERLINRLTKAENTYKGVIGGVEAKLSSKIEFDFGIEWQPSDGFVIVNAETSDVAGFENCIDLINREGKLTKKNFKKITF